MARYTDESRERVRDAVDFGELVGARTELKAAGVRRLQGLCPVPRRAHAVVRHRPGREALPLLRLRRGWRPLPVRHGDRGAGLRGRAGIARRALSRAARARDRGPAGRGAPPAQGAPVRAARADGRVLRAGALGGARGRNRARVPGLAWAAAGRATRLPRGLGARCLRSRVERLASCRLQRGGAEGRGAHPAEQGALRGDRSLPRPDHVPARGRARPRARVRRSRDEARSAAEVPQHLRRRGLSQGPDRLRRRPGACGGRQGRARRAGRGLHRRDRAAPGGRAGGRRPDGHRADRGPGRCDRSARAEGAAVSGP